MLYDVLNYLNNWFVMTSEYSTTWAIVADGVTGTFSEEYLAGQYISIDGTKLNDGVYKITEVATNKLTLDATMTAETPTDLSVFSIWGLGIPPRLLSIVSEIETYTSGAQTGLKSESQGQRSVTYATGSDWTQVYKAKLMPWKRMFSDKLIKRNYKWQDRF